MSIPYESCPFHSDEDQPEKLLAEDGWHLTCLRTDHPVPGPYTWPAADVSDPASGATGLAAELGLAVELPAALGEYQWHWVEYGVLEVAYAAAQPKDFAGLVERYGHTAVASSPYTASKFLGRTLGAIARTGALHHRFARGTGRWSYDREISWWSLDPETPWKSRISWESLQQPMSHVPGVTEICPIGRCRASDPTDCPHFETGVQA